MWEIKFSNSKSRPYYFNTETKDSSWDPPAGLSPEEIKQLPGSHYLSGTRPGQVRASHLLVKHSGSRRPASWKEAKITRSKEEAIAILQGFQSEINSAPSPADKFKELAQIHSDCSSHDHAGDLGWFGPGQMQKPFEDGAFGLEVGHISGVVDSDSGVHLIMRTG
ncbi:rotamase-domain-containing protein [Mycena floridula]|nr:rotamase-domain-containing protein [Mycena floridula]